METIERRRLDWVDVAKGVAMLGILLQHMSFFDMTGKATFVHIPYVAFYDVPLFFIVAGLFLNRKQSLGTFALQKAFRLLIPYVITCLILGVFVLGCKVLVGSTKPPTYWTGVKEFLRSALYGGAVAFKTLPHGVKQIGAIWFLQALFVALVEIRVVIELFENRPLIALIIVGLLASFALLTRSMYYIPCNVQQGFVGGVFVYAGYLYRRYIGFDRAYSFAILLILSFVYLISVKLVSPLYISDPVLGDGLLTLVASLCSCLLLFELSKRIEQHFPQMTGLLCFIGRNSLVILCVHLVFLDCGFRLFVGWILGAILQGVAPNNLVSAVNLALQLALCSLAVLGVRRTRYLRRVFY